MTDKFACPRRVGELGPWKRDAIEDCWRLDGTCSFCGSLRPEHFMRCVESGGEVVPTDKNYKAYLVPGHDKFYFQHLSEDQMQRFVELLNAKTMKIGYPGHFYVPPFFVQFGPPTKPVAEEGSSHEGS